MGRLVPFLACSAANCINIPMMRRLELQEGTPLTTREGERVGLSKLAAREGILRVTLSRIGMAMPGLILELTYQFVKSSSDFEEMLLCTSGMVLIPVIVNSLDRRGLFRVYPRLVAPLQVGLCGLILSLSTPLCCAIFQQEAQIKLDKLEPHIQEKFKHCNNKPDVLYYNKGL